METRHIDYVRQRFSSDIDDRDIAWALQLYRSRTQLEWCLPLLRRQYPRSRVLLIADGDEDDYADLAAKYRCVYIHGAHLMRLETCHLYVARLMRQFLEGSESYCFRIDPDTRVWRRFVSLPAFSCVFGTLETVSEGAGAEILTPPNVQGGCIGMTRDVVADLVESGVLCEELCYRRCFSTWARCVDMVKTASRGTFCDDFVISWAAGSLGVPIVDSSEIRSRWRRVTPNVGLRYAVTHPHKMIPFGALARR